MVCGGPIGDDRLNRGIPCRRCVGDADEFLKMVGDKVNLKIIWDNLPGASRSRFSRSEFRKYVKVVEKADKFMEVFKKAVGNRPWSVQMTWAKRVFLKDSFSIVAPTGIGKTVFGIVMSIYKTYYEVMEGSDKAYIILPTTTLVKQVYQKTIQFLENLGLDTSHVIAYHSDMSKRERREAINRVEEGDFKILITTNQFVSARFDKLARHTFEFVFVDDVDAILRSSKNIENIIILLMRKDRRRGKWKDTDESGYAEALRQRMKEIIDKLIEIRRAAREKDWDRIAQLRKEIESYKEMFKTMGSLVISSATGRPRGIKVKLFKELLNFEVGLRSENIRNIIDAYQLVASEEELEGKVIRYASQLGRGGLIYVPVDKGVEYAEQLAAKLNREGVKADILVSGRLDSLDRFLRGELDVLVGVAIYYGVMVRGLDYPEHVRYAIFAGTPRFKFNARFTEPTVTQMAKTLKIIKDVVDEEEKRDVERMLRLVNNVVRRSTVYRIKKLNEILRGESPPESRFENRLLEILEYIRRKMEDPKIIDRILNHPEVSVKLEDGELYLLIPDVYTYIQASGRTSRMYAGGITKGLSIVIDYDEKLLNILQRRMSLIFEEVSWKHLSQVDLNRVKREIDEDRRRVRDIRLGRVKAEYKDPIRPVLIIVESPNKARTIARFFGRPSIRRRNGFAVYEVSTGDLLISVTASGGHVFDLVERLEEDVETMVAEELGVERDRYIDLYSVLVDKSDEKKFFIPVYGSIKICSEGHQFVVPKKLELGGRTYEVCPKCYRTYRRKWNRRRKNKTSEEERLFYDDLTKMEIRDKGEVINFLRRLALETGTVFIGTDPDTEGEKIGWDLASMVKPYTEELKRIEFHEVTRRAISTSIKESRDLKEELVEAQIVRRIEDRWIGFELTRKLFQHMRGRSEKGEWFRDTFMGGWSAGRVQTPVLGWIVDRNSKVKGSEREGIVLFIWRNGERRLTLKRPLSIEEKERLKKILPEPIKKKTKEGEGGEKEEPKGETKVKLIVREIRERVINPAPPFTTDTLLREANRRFRMDSKLVMRIAQDLFESGLITYHRTDSTRISEEGMGIAKKYLTTVYGEKGLKSYYPRRWGEGGAHEAIRPTRPIDVEMLRDMIREGDITPPIDFSENHYRIYGLIFDRFIASQLKPAKAKEAVVEFEIDGFRISRRFIEPPPGSDKPIEEELKFIVDIEGEVESRFYRVMVEVIPEFGRDGVFKAEYMYKSVYLLSDYTEGEVIEEMRRKGIGRPSTYATVVSTLKERRYVRLVGKVFLVPTDKGKKVYNLLMSRYRDFVSEERTRIIQEYMDDIERGKRDYVEVLKTLYSEIEQIRSIESSLSQARLTQTAGPRLGHTGPF